MHSQSSSGDKSSPQETSIAVAEENVPARPVYVLDARSERPVLATVMEARKQRNRERNTPTQRRCRARKRAADGAEIEAMLAGLEVAKAEPLRLSRDEIVSEKVALDAWLEIDGPAQRQFRRERTNYLAARIIALEYRREIDGDPSPASFVSRWAARMTSGEVIVRERAKTLLRGLARLEAAGGPWQAR